MSRHGKTSAHSILWRRLDLPGHEHARVAPQGAFWRLSGASVFLYEGKPCRFDYFIACDSRWHTLSGQVSGWLGDERIEIEYSVDAQRRWRLHGAEVPAVEGCVDADLNFSPSTNLLPVRRLNLEVGQEARVQAAWLRFPDFRFEVLEQLYRRTGPTSYHYESGGGSFTAELEVDAAGFVDRYGDLWQAER
jgi:hypothetical protein